MKTKQTILLFLLVGLLSLNSCSSDDSVSGNTNPIDGVRIKTITSQQLVGGQWKDTYKTTNTFEGNNLMMSSSLTQKWDTNTSQWENYNQSLYTLYDSNHASQQVIQNWDAATSTWTNQSRGTFTDNTNGDRLKTENENWVAGSWQLNQKADFLYDDNGYLIRLETTLWETSTSSWATTPANKQVYTNNAQGKPILTETFIGTDTSPYSKEIITYDANGFFNESLGANDLLGQLDQQLPSRTNQPSEWFCKSDQPNQLQS